MVVAVDRLCHVHLCGDAAGVVGDAVTVEARFEVYKRRRNILIMLSKEHFFEIGIL